MLQCSAGNPAIRFRCRACKDQMAAPCSSIRRLECIICLTWAAGGMGRIYMVMLPVVSGSRFKTGSISLSLDMLHVANGIMLLA